MFGVDKDINIIFNTEEGIGYGYVYTPGDGYVHSQVFQSRLNQDLLDEGKSFTEITEEITQSKGYTTKRRTVFEAVNDTLDFYLLPEVKELPKAEQVNSIQEAIEMMNSSSKPYLIFQIE